MRGDRAVPKENTPKSSIRNFCSFRYVFECCWLKQSNLTISNLCSFNFWVHPSANWRSQNSLVIFVTRSIIKTVEPIAIRMPLIEPTLRTGNHSIKLPHQSFASMFLGWSIPTLALVSLFCSATGFSTFSPSLPSRSTASTFSPSSLKSAS